MAYNTPDISFSPAQNFTFNPSQQNNNPVGVNENLYVPACNDPNRMERETYRRQVAEYANLYGQRIDYWSNGFNVDKMNFIYGEDPLARFRGSRRMKAVVDFSSYTAFITKWGMMTDLEITIYIPITAFRDAWGDEIIPLIGDLFIITDSACDRPAGQSPIVFEVTEKKDSINPVDYLGGHYYWKLTAKRYDNSYEPGAPQEKFLGGPVVDGDYGKIESEDSETIIIKSEPEKNNVDEAAKEDFDLPAEETSIYGKYY